MPKHEEVSNSVNLAQWVEEAKKNPDQYRDRQVTEILLTAIGLTPTLKDSLVLKGGTLMAVAFGSERATGDVDFTTHAPPANFPDLLREELDKALPRAAADLGYTDLICRVQTVKKLPKPAIFEDADFPALQVTIASARRGTSEQTRLELGQSPRVLDMEISFNEQVYAFQELRLDGPRVAIMAYAMSEIVAEKLRALLQQPIRNRTRRQDVFDIAYLLDTFPINDEGRKEVFDTLVSKCQTRDITPDIDSLDNPEVIERARREWTTLQAELTQPLPDFDERLAVVRALYRSLPWDSSGA
jgi:predicted nucleotidyltransferase component of viral defense system